MLKVLMLRRSIDAKKAELAELEDKDAEFQTREAELEASINEVEPGNAEQEAVVEAEVEKYESEKAEHGEKKQTLSSDIERLENELEEIERMAPKPQSPEKSKKNETVRGDTNMEMINIRALPMNGPLMLCPESGAPRFWRRRIPRRFWSRCVALRARAELSRVLS